MKKLIALLIAMALVFSVAAFASKDEEAIAVEDYTPTALAEEDILDFGITLDKLPEGYEMKTFDTAGSLYVLFESENDPTLYYVSIAHSEYFDNYTLNVAEMSEEQLENLKETLSAEYVEPVFSFTKTAYGTDVIVIEENGDCSYDYVEYVTIYEGYFISLGILTDTPITEAEMETALTLLSDMWIVPVN